MIFNKADFIASYGISSQLPESDRPELSFSGRSNVGKSSLINKLCNRKNLARVSSTPGKTATINFYAVDDCYFVDLPGYGFAKVSKEEKLSWGKMMQDYFATTEDLCHVFHLVDIRHEPGNNDKIMYKWILDHGYEPVIIATKLDKIKRSQVQKQIKLVRQGLQVVPGTKIIPFSAQTKQGREEIWELIDELTGMAEQEKTPEA